ncbi:MAG: CoA transferase [Dehalococcoidia bacterium]|nr:CoA transferase [Dehalococcoidia bacterium]
MTSALTGLRVVDFSHGLSGPYVTKLFADNGADVVKIERPGTGDYARRLGPFPDDLPHPETGGMFLDLNTSKQSLTLNLKSATGRRIAERLIADADLVVESFRPGVVERLGLDYARVAAISPHAVMLSISNFGQSGPYRDYLGNDMLLYAMASTLSVTGQPDREPVKIGLYTPLFLAAGTAAALTNGALWGAQRDGIGQHIDLALMEVLTGTLDRAANNIMAVAYSGDVMFRRSKEYRRSILPSGVYPCADGYVHMVAQPFWWDRFCRTIDRPDLIDDAHFKDNLFNMAVVDELDVILYEWLMRHTKQQIMEKAQGLGLPVTALSTMEDVFHDPQFRSRDYFIRLDHPFAGELEYPGPPFRLTESPSEIRRAPTLGEHNEPILCGRLGYTRQELVVLRQSGVI